MGLSAGLIKAKWSGKLFGIYSMASKLATHIVHIVGNFLAFVWKIYGTYQGALGWLLGNLAFDARDKEYVGSSSLEVFKRLDSPL